LERLAHPARFERATLSTASFDSEYTGANFNKQG